MQKLKTEGLMREYGRGEKIPVYLILFRNRYARVVIYGLALCITSNLYLGWQRLSIMIEKEEVYRYLCTDHSRTCDTERDEVQKLIIFASSAEFALSALAGFVFDHVGPIFTSLFGEVMYILGLILLRFKVMKLSVLLLGASTNFTAYSALVLADMFPERPAFAMGYTICAQLLASSVAIPLEHVYNTLKWNRTLDILIYAVVLPIAILYLMALPVSRDGLINLWKKEEEIVSDVENSYTPEEENLIASDSRKNLSYLQIFKSMGKDLCTVEFGIFTIVYCIGTSFHSYYQPALNFKFNSEAPIRTHLSYMMPAQSVTGLIGAFLLDIVSTLYAMIAIQLSVMLMFGLLLNKSMNVNYIGAVVYVVFNSVIYTTKFTYFESVYPSNNFGFIVGTCGTLSGIIGFFFNFLCHKNFYNGTIWTATFLPLVFIPGLFYLQYKYQNEDTPKNKYIEKTITSEEIEITSKSTNL